MMLLLSFHFPFSLFFLFPFLPCSLFIFFPFPFYLPFPSPVVPLAHCCISCCCSNVLCLLALILAIALVIVCFAVETSLFSVGASLDTCFCSRMEFWPLIIEVIFPPFPIMMCVRGEPCNFFHPNFLPTNFVVSYKNLFEEPPFLHDRKSSKFHLDNHISMLFASRGIRLVRGTVFFF